MIAPDLTLQIQNKQESNSAYISHCSIQYHREREKHDIAFHSYISSNYIYIVVHSASLLVCTIHTL